MRQFLHRRDFVSVTVDVVNLKCAGILPSALVVCDSVTTDDEIGVVGRCGTNFNLRSCEGECLHHAAHLVVDATIVITLVCQFHTFADKTDNRNPVKTLEVVRGRLLWVFVVEVKDVAFLLFVEVVVAHTDTFRVAVVLHIGTQVTRATEKVFVLLVETERYDFKHDNVSGILECRVIPIKQDIPCVNRLDERYSVLHTYCEECVPIIEYIIVDFIEERIQSALEAESEQVVSFRSERCGTQLRDLDGDIGSHQVHDNERVIGHACPFGVIVVCVAKVPCGKRTANVKSRLVELLVRKFGIKFF